MRLPKVEDRFGLLLALLVVSFLFTGAADSGALRLFAGLINVAALIVAFTSASWSIKWPLLGGLVVTGVAGSILVSVLDIDQTGAAVGALAQVAVLSAATYAVLDRIVSHERVSTETILGALSAYFLIGQVFAWIYAALAGVIDEPVLAPAEGLGVPVYYSYVVLTTLGFGDITPVDPLAQRITVIEALTGQIFLTVLVARLVSMYSRPARESG